MCHGCANIHQPSITATGSLLDLFLLTDCIRLDLLNIYSPFFQEVMCNSITHPDASRFIQWYEGGSRVSPPSLFHSRRLHLGEKITVRGELQGFCLPICLLTLLGSKNWSRSNCAIMSTTGCTEENTVYLGKLKKKMNVRVKHNAAFDT